MNVVYYPSEYVLYLDRSDALAKTLVLMWGKIQTIVPPSQKHFIDDYLAGRAKGITDCNLDLYKKVNDLAGQEVLGFLTMSDGERRAAMDKMFYLVCDWNKDTKFFETFRIKSLEDIEDKWLTYYWFLHEKLEEPLVQLLLEERLAYCLTPRGGIVVYEETGRSYLSLIIEEVKQARKVNLVTDDEFSLIPRVNSNLVKRKNTANLSTYQLVSIAVPEIFLGEKVAECLTWKQVLNIRKDIYPLAEQYHKELQDYQNAINVLSAAGKDDEAFEKLAEFCERVAVSFRPFEKEFSTLVHKMKNPSTFALINGIAIPLIKLLSPEAEIQKICEITAISSASANYIANNVRLMPGFDYLTNLNHKLRVERLKNLVTYVIPKGLFQKLNG